MMFLPPSQSMAMLTCHEAVADVVAKHLLGREAHVARPRAMAQTMGQLVEALRQSVTSLLMAPPPDAVARAADLLARW